MVGRHTCAARSVMTRFAFSGGINSTSISSSSRVSCTGAETRTVGLEGKLVASSARCVFVVEKRLDDATAL